MMASKRLSTPTILVICSVAAFMASVLMLYYSSRDDYSHYYDISPSSVDNIEAASQEMRNITNSDMPIILPEDEQPSPANCPQPPANGVIEGELLWCFVHRARRIWPFTDPLCGVRNWQDFGNNTNSTVAARILETPEAAHAEEGEFPWFIRIVEKFVSYKIVDPAIYDIRREVTLKNFCGGSMITKNHGLTAAHCCHPMKDNITDFGLIIGYWEGSQPPKNFLGSDKYRDLADCVEHPEYSHDEWVDNDIAVLKWTRPIGPPVSRDYKIVVNTVCLPLAPSFYHYVGGDAEIAGAGRYENRVGGDAQAVHLWKAPLLMPNSVRSSPCQSPRPPIQIMSCRTKPHGSSVCFGDSGSPITKWNWTTQRGRPYGNYLRSYQIGIVSVVPGAVRRPLDCTKARGVGMTNVSNYREFIINEVMRPV